MIGSTVSHYEIIEEIGRGGMGVVYKARDTMLDRLVALKFLPAGLTSDPESTQRFIREAKAGASSDHPNICTIYEIARSDDGQMFIAMAYYAGSTLRERLGDGPLEYREAIDIVRQIGAGLSAAHEKGVTHRDIKPGNIQITEAGQVKILDFGLAKLKGGIDLTRTGSTHGTPAYMSPEQIRGDEIDERTDIWSLGAVLFELLSGKKAFEGDYEQAIAYSIMHGNPDLTRRLGGEIPPGLALVLRKALEKDPDRRYQSVAEFLEALHSETQASEASANIRLFWNRLYQTIRVRRSLVGGVSALVLISALIAWFGRSGTWGQGQTVVSRAVHKQLTFDGKSWNPSISPDGEFVAYFEFEGDAWSGNPWFVKIIDLRGQTTQTVFEADSGDWVRVGPWSPDGTRFLIRVFHGTFSKNDLVLVPRLGGQTRVLARRDINRDVREAGNSLCWARDGNVVYSADSRGLYTSDLRTGENSFKKMDGLLPTTVQLDCSSVDDRLLYVMTQGDFRPPVEFTILRPGHTGTQRIYTTDKLVSSASWSRDGRSIYFLAGGAMNSSLFRLDLGTNDRPTGPATELLSSIAWGGGVSITADNARLTLGKRHTNSELLRVDLSGGSPSYSRLSGSTLLELVARVSPDGQSVMFVRRGDLFEMPIEGGPDRQITRFGNVRNGAWSPDGTRIAFTRRDSVRSVWVINRDGSSARRIDTGDFTPSPGKIDWPSDSEIFASDVEGSLFVVDPDGPSVHLMVPGGSEGSLHSPRSSPDGKQIALYGHRNEQQGMWLFTRSDSTVRFIYPNAFPIDWSEDAKSVFVFDERSRDVVRYDLADGKTQKLIEGKDVASRTGVEALYLEEDWISRHGNTFIILIYEGLSDIWIIDNFDPTKSAE